MDNTSPTFTIETITPQLAGFYLQKNTKNNRKVTKKTVGNYAADMMSGNWRLSPDCIAFDEDDNLINGQHRMEAVISSGKPVKFGVLRRFPKDSMECFDIGKRRQMHERLTISGIPMTQSECSIVRNLYSKYATNGKYAGNLGTERFSNIRHDDFVKNQYLKHDKFIALLDELGYLQHGFNKFFVIAAIKIACLTRSKLTFWSGRNAEYMIIAPNAYQMATIRALQFLEIVKTGYLEKTGVFNPDTDRSALALREMYLKHKATGRNWASFPALNLSNSAGYSFAMNESRNSVRQTINDPFDTFFNEDVCTNQIICDDARGNLPDTLSPEIKGLIVKHGDYV
jgi:hypothetical protein